MMYFALKGKDMHTKIKKAGQYNIILASFLVRKYYKSKRFFSYVEYNSLNIVIFSSISKYSLEANL